MPRMRATRRAAFGGGRGDQQRGRHLVQLADVGRARVLQRLGGDGGDRDRHVRKRLVAARRGDDDVARVDRLLLARLVLRPRRRPSRRWVGWVLDWSGLRVLARGELGLPNSQRPDVETCLSATERLPRASHADLRHQEFARPPGGDERPVVA